MLLEKNRRYTSTAMEALMRANGVEISGTVMVFSSGLRVLSILGVSETIVNMGRVA